MLHIKSALVFVVSFQTATQGDGAFFQANLGLGDK